MIVGIQRTQLAMASLFVTQAIVITEALYLVAPDFSPKDDPVATCI